MQKKRIPVVGILFCVLDSWKTDCVWFSKFASLFAFVLFASGCVVRIGYESFLDCSLQEFFYVSRMANSIFRFLLDSCYCKLSTLCRGQLAPYLKDALPLCPFGTFPHTVGNHPRRAEPARPQFAFGGYASAK